MLKAIVSKRVLVELALMAGVFSLCTGEFAMMGLLSSFSAAFSIPETQAANLISAYAIGVVIGAPIMVFVGVYLSKRNLIVFLLGVYTVANAISFFSTNYELLLFSRVMAGFPHAAYFGVAAVLAASNAPFNKRGKAVSRVLMGVTAAILLGAPGATYIGQELGWRWIFAGISFVSLIGLFLLHRYAPDMSKEPPLNVKHELASFANSQVWLTLGIAAIGFSGMFGVYSYLAPIILNVTRLEDYWIAPMLIFFGVGTLVGNYAGGWLYDRFKFASVKIILTFSLITLLLFPLLAGSKVGVAVATMALGSMIGLCPALQMRLMDVSKHGQQLIAASNHAALNAANALGPWLGGMAITAGFGWTSPAIIGAAMALCASFLYWTAKRLS